MPILVLIVALPLLRPLRHPNPQNMSDDEAVRLATIQAMAENGTQAIDALAPPGTSGVVRHSGHLYSTQPPTLAALLAGPYWIMAHVGLPYSANAVLVPYLLTLIGVTLPVAVVAGLVYRMGRLFELPRPWRTTLAGAVVFGGGLISYATVLNAHAPAAAALLGSAACLVHLSALKQPLRGAGWLLVAGFLAALATVVDPTVVPFLLLLIAVILCMRWPLPGRLGGTALYALGAVAPLALHAALATAVYGTWLPATMLLHESGVAAATAPANTTAPAIAENETAADETPSRWVPVGAFLGRLTESLFGRHGIISHFPVVLIGLLGVGAVMHRHWPATTKALASVSVAGALTVVIAVAASRVDWTGAMFATRWFVAFVPLLLFWAGAWVRRGHRPVTWAIAAILLAFSIIVSLAGACNPYPREGYGSYLAGAPGAILPDHVLPAVGAVTIVMLWTNCANPRI